MSVTNINSLRGAYTSARDYDTTEIVEKDKAHWLHPWLVFDEFKDHGSLPLGKAEGIYVYDLEGKQYIDGAAGLWCTNIGSGRKEMADAIAEQVCTMHFASTFTAMTNVPATLLSEKLAELAPGNLSRVIYTTGGTTATESAYRLIQYYQGCRGTPEKKHVITRKSGYHGTTYLAISLSGDKNHTAEFEYKTDTIHQLSSPNNFHRPEGMEGLTDEQFSDALVKEFVDKVEELGADNVAAFFAEPVQGAGGVIPPHENYLQRIWEVCKENDILYVADEVITAFGRLGHWFASYDEYGVQPDIIITAKGITSGYIPLGAAIFSEDIYEVISEPGHGRYFAHGFTYAGHPVACAAALKNIEIIERENILDHVKNDVGPYFEEQLNTLRDIPIVGDVRGRQLMMCIEFVKDQKTKESFPVEIDVGSYIAKETYARGLILRGFGNYNIMSPPLILTREDVDVMVRRLREAYEAAIVKLKEDGHL